MSTIGEEMTLTPTSVPPKVIVMEITQRFSSLVWLLTLPDTPEMRAATLEDILENKDEWCVQQQQTEVGPQDPPPASPPGAVHIVQQNSIGQLISYVQKLQDDVEALEKENEELRVKLAALEIV